jgi:hypothetical protein
VRSFDLAEQTATWKPKLQEWARLVASGRADDFKETALPPDLLTDIFCGLLGYTGPAGASGIAADADENTEVRSVIDVDSLGHIFEQSITDLERLRLSLEHPNVGQRVPPAFPSAHNLPGGAGGTHCPTLEPEAGDESVDETRARKRRKQEGRRAAGVRRAYGFDGLREI